MRVYTIAAPNWDAWADSYYTIYDNEIGYIFHRQFNLAGAELAPALWLMYIDHTKTLSDVRDDQATGDARAHRGDAYLVSADLGRTLLADINLQDRILDAILAETGGSKVERFCREDMAEFTNMYLQRLGHKHINFVWAGGYMGSWMQRARPTG